ncbi:succinate dehydrogenase cytochrome b subunit [Cryomorpha ignava]|uniref:Succinate dehydrogenase cytochrome b subunit n=1 Tax=Cryomorpha ignava TaxID=101383 RepID=A0A7K3WV73_9FLAO|nr:succinate dehydrogenase cytochrome b subunit [Cryomorpha ignava]NEN24812.1 succinate dehydrogenase cytochrome b subunit [Cryomorpha ignava]
MSNSALIQSSLAKKYWMAATGLFLCLFLVGHLAGNLQLLISGEEGLLQFNEYAKFMTSNPVVMILSYLTYISILFHAIDGFVLTVQNRKARPKNYAYSKPSENSLWTSRNMALLGTIILVFIILHMRQFWYVMHWGPIGVDSAGNKDLYTVTITAFTDGTFGLLYTIGYVVAMVAIALHLSHGFQSAFQSLGLRTDKLKKAIIIVGYIFAMLIPLLFAIIPVYIHLTH